MSMKRQAASQLTHDNWDQDDAADHEEMGTYKVADKAVLEKRVMRTAKRRFQASGDEPKKNVFSGFGGFNKAQPSSFDFLANLSETNGTSATKSEDTVTSSVFTNSALGKVATDVFGVPSTATKADTAVGNSPANNIFAMSSTSASSSASPFAALKADSTVGGGLFTKRPSISPIITATPTPPKTSLFSNISQDKPALPFGINTTPMKSQNSDFDSLKKDVPVAAANADENKGEKESKSKKQAYYSMLKGLNESVSAWITKHVEETPLCILTPIFRDYEKHLKAIKDEYENNVEETENKDTKSIAEPEAPAKPTPTVFSINPKPSPTSEVTDTEDKSAKTVSFGMKPATPASSLTSPSTGFKFGINKKVDSSVPEAESGTKPPSNSFAPNTGASPPATPTVFSINPKPSPTSEVTNTEDKSAKTFSFGMKPATTASSLTSPSTGFKFGINKKADSSVPEAESGTKPPSFSFAPNTGTSPPAPFSFGMGSKFSFSPNTQQKPEQSTMESQEPNDDEPPKVEFTPVIEENSVYEKRCKVFVKKDGNFADKGVGTLYVKKIEDSAKHQLIVRANTNLGSLLVNIILGSGVPTQRMGKNNVMLVCIPTPDAKPPPTPILIRVKTAEEADELLETLDKYRHIN